MLNALSERGVIATDGLDSLLLGGFADMAPVPVPAFVYWMTDRARRERDGEPFSSHYREACAKGAREHRLRVNHYARP